MLKKLLILLSLFMTLIPISLSATTNPIAEYRLDECSGTTAEDNRNNYDGSKHSVTEEENGVLNSASSFNGSAYIDISNSNLSTSEFSISVWFKATNTDGYHGIVTKNEKDGGKNYFIFIKNGYLYYGVGNDQTSVEAVNANEWYHVVVTHDTANSSKVYLNGTFKDDWDWDFTPSDVDLVIGALLSNNLSDYLFEGLIDEVKVYDRALSSSEVSDLYDSDSTNAEGRDSTSCSSSGTSGGGGSGSGGGEEDNNDPDLIVDYRLDECSGSTVYDHSENAINATADSGATVTNDGWINNGKKFNGTSSAYVDIPEDSKLVNMNSAFTVSFWMKATDVDNWQGLVTNLYSYGVSILINPNYDNHVLVYVYDSDGNGYYKGVTQTIYANTWYHITYTYDHSKNESKLYCDTASAVEDSPAVITGQRLDFQAGKNFNLGSVYSGNHDDYMYTGRLDEVKFFNKVLSASEIEAIWNNEKTRYKNYTGDHRNGWSINDVTISEGDYGTKDITISYSLNHPAPCNGASVNYSLANGSATAGEDYNSKSGTLSLSSGQSSGSITLSGVIIGDIKEEGSETFTINLSSPSHSSIIDGQATITITNDDNESDYFITTWHTSSSDESITIPTTGSGYDYVIDWGDGSATEHKTGNASHTYSSSNDYTVKIKGTFPRIYFNNSGDKTKIITINQWGTGAWTSMNGAFFGCSNLQGDASDTPNLTNVTDMYAMFAYASSFNQDIGNWNVSNITNMESLFNRATSFNQNIGSWNVANVTNMKDMFYSATSFNQDIGNWNVANVTDMQGMFSKTSNFNQDINSWNVGKVIYMNNMFRESSFNQDIGNWDVSNVTNMFAMFYISPFNKNIGNWDVSSVTNMQSMFNSATSFNQDIGSWNVSNVTNMRYMFKSSAFNKDISSWNVNNVTNMFEMFYKASSFNQDLSSWNISKVTNFSHILLDTSLSTKNYDKLLSAWDDQVLKSGVTFDTNAKYCAGKNPREHMISTDNWTINDGGRDCSAYNPIAEYHLDESLWNGTSGEVKDSAGSYNGTAVGGATTSTHKRGQVCESGIFDGVDDYVDMGDVLDPGSSEWSVSTWFKWDGNTTEESQIIYNKEELYEAFITEDGYFRYAFQPHWTSDGRFSFPVEVGVWTHALVTYDGEKQKLYKNGVLVYEREQTGEIGTNNKKLLIGARGDTDPYSFFSGDIDEVEFFNIALPAPRVHEMYVNEHSKFNFDGSTRACANSTVYKSCYDWVANDVTLHQDDGVYWIDPNGGGSDDKFEAYCDMSSEGGGWTLVWSNIREVSDKYETGLVWDKAINTTPLINGIPNSNDLSSFQVYTGLRYWELLAPNGEIKYSWANEGTDLDQAFIADFSFDEGNNYTIHMENALQTIGSRGAGILHYHNNRPFSTIDSDHDEHDGNCANKYSDTPWWYGRCWDGSINGGGANSGHGYYNGAYWDDSEKKWGLDDGTGAGNGWIWVREGTPPAKTIAEYHFDECTLDGTEDEIKDSTTNNFNGKAYDINPNIGKIQNSIDLTKSSATDYISLDSDALNDIDDFTISIWIKTSTNDSHALLSAANSSEDNELLMWINDSKFFPHVKDSYDSIDTPNLADNSWHMITWTREDDKNCVYIDDSLSGCVTGLSAGTLKVDPGGFILGQDQDNLGGGFNAGQDFEGYLDELKIFNQVLNLEQIQAIYNNENASKNYDASTRDAVVCEVCDMIAITDIPKTECEALEALYDSTDGDNWTHNTNWKTHNTKADDWYGVTANGGHVKKLVLRTNNLVGTIPTKLGDLPNMTHLYLFSNQLSGEIPSELGNLTALNYLFLNSNQLSGAIPSQLGNLSNLIYLILDHNQLSGGIPSELGNLSKLTKLYLHINQLTGSIPSELGNLSVLTELNFNTNQLTGSIPSELTNLSELMVLDLSRNDLTGGILGALDNLSNLTHLYLHDNQLTGTIPKELGNLSNLTVLSIYNNQLVGFIPTELGNLSKLTHLYLHQNQLTGELPPEIGNITTLRYFYVTTNNLRGGIPDEYVNLTNLKHFYAGYNHFTGEIPEFLKDLDTSNGTAYWHGVDLNNNDFTFLDIEPNYQAIVDVIGTSATTGFDCTPQNKVDTPREVSYIENNTLTITPQVPENPSGHDSYQWYKDGTVIDGATDRVYTKAHATNDDEGIYTYHITNSVVTELTLVSEDITVGKAIPVAEYRFDKCNWDGSDGEVEDSSTNNYNGTVKLGTTTVDKDISNGGINNSAKFSNSYIELPNLPHLASSKSITAWFKTSDIDKAEQRIFVDDENNDLGSYGLTFGDPGSGKVRFYIHGLSATSLDSPNVIENNKWYFVAATFNSTSMKKELYIYDTDGTLLSNVSQTVTGTLNTPSGIASIGGETDNGETNARFDGFIDELKIFDVALSQSSIQDIYNNEKAHKNYDSSHRMAIDCTTPELLAEYKFDECKYTGANGEVIDSIGENSNGTIVDLDKVEVDKEQKKIGHSIKLDGGAVDIDNLTVSTDQYKKNTVIFWMYWDGTNHIMPFGWNTYDLWFDNGNFGFNARDNLLYGLDSTNLDNGWHHISAVFTNGDVESNRLYIDGNLQTIEIKQGTINNNNSYAQSSARISGWKTDNNYRFSGYLDELKIYKGELDSTTISNIYSSENSATRSIICSIPIFNAVNQSGGCFNWNNNITTKIAGDSINLTILAGDENDNNNSLTDVNITKLELLSFSDVSCSTLSDTYELWSGNEAVDASGCYTPSTFTHDKAIKCAKIKITGIYEGESSESNSTDTFSIRPDKFILTSTDDLTQKLTAEHDYTVKAKAVNSDGTTITEDYNIAVTPTHSKYFRDDSDGSAMDGDFVPTIDFTFSDGQSSDTTLSFNNVGKIGVELNDTIWAEVDSDDTPLEDRTIYLEQNLTFIPDRFDINFTTTPTMQNYHAERFTYFANDETQMGAELINLDLTITAVGANGAVMTNYQNPQTTYYSNDSNFSLALSVENNPTISSDINESGTKDLGFNAGVATLHYADLDFNYGRERNVTKEPITINGSNSDLNVTIVDSIDTNVKATKIETFAGDATFYYGRLIFEDIKTTDTPTSGNTKVLVCATAPISTYKQESSSWYLNEDDNITSLVTGDFYPRKKRNYDSTDLSSDTAISSLSSILDGEFDYDITRADTTKSLKSIYHIKIPTWLWYSKYNDYSFTSSDNCSQHPCIEYIYQSASDPTVTGIQSGDFNGTKFQQNFNTHIKKKAIKLLR